MIDLNDIIFSWSRVNYTCLADFYQTYVWGEKGEDNGWNILGSFCHEIVEAVGKGEITQEEGLQRFKDNYWDVVSAQPFPATKFWPDPEQSYYDKILPFFEKEVWWEGELVSVEEHLEFTLPSGERFQGYIDQVRLNNGKLYITDFKVAKAYIGEELNKKIMQLYIYAYGYHQIHNKYPDYLEYIWFQNKFKPTVVPFNKVDMDKTVDFIEDRIRFLKEKVTLAKKEKGHFPPIDFDNYYCNNICSHRNNCAYKNRQITNYDG